MKKRYISTSAGPMATKIDMLAYDRGSPPSGCMTQEPLDE